MSDPEAERRAPRFTSEELADMRLAMETCENIGAWEWYGDTEEVHDARAYRGRCAAAAKRLRAMLAEEEGT